MTVREGGVKQWVQQWVRDAVGARQNLALWIEGKYAIQLGVLKPADVQSKLVFGSANCGL
jgi:hypothetical protein